MVAVTFRTTEVTPYAGTPWTPATFRATTPPGPTLACGAPRPARVSIRRLGWTGTYLTSETSASTVTGRLVDILPFFAVARIWTRWLPRPSIVATRVASPATVATGVPSTSSSNEFTSPAAVLVEKSTTSCPGVFAVPPGATGCSFTAEIFSRAAGPAFRIVSSCGYSWWPGHSVLKPSRWPETVRNW